MNPQTVRETFEVRYYYWSLADFQREWQEGFPLLRMIKGIGAYRFLSSFERFRQKDRLSVALVKRFHKKALEILDESMTSKEELACQLFRDLMLTPAPNEQEIINQSMSGKISFKLNRRKFAAFIKDAMHPIFGNISEQSGANEWRYVMQVGDWEVHTYVDIGGRHSQLSYYHYISAAKPCVLRERINLFLWLGIASQTDWNWLTDADTPMAAQTLAQVCGHFMQAVPYLLEGLFPD